MSLRRVGFGVAVVAGLLLIGEIVGREAYGIGDPPLFAADEQIEYLALPNQDCDFMGRRIAYNNWSMRSDDFPLHKADAREYRVMVIGDSVVNGGPFVDQSEVATQLLQTTLAWRWRVPVRVGNIAANSWGPPNELAYVKRYGLFDADAVAIVVSSHDYADVPTFEPAVGVRPDLPAAKPIFALSGLLARAATHLKLPGGAPGSVSPEDVAASTRALTALIGAARAQTPNVAVFLHWERDELEHGPDEGNAVLAETARNAGVPVIQLDGRFREALRSGRNPYRDHIHPNVLGHALLAQALLEFVVSEPALGREVAPARLEQGH